MAAEALLGRKEATIFELLRGRPGGHFFEPSCNGLNLRKNSILKVEVSKTGIYYNASLEGRNFGGIYGNIQYTPMIVVMLI